MAGKTPVILSPAEVTQALATLPGWSLREGALHRAFEFRDFQAAFAFMQQVAALAEAQGHHPDWSNSYRRVWITLVTHEAGGITERDIRLAQAISTLDAR